MLAVRIPVLGSLSRGAACLPWLAITLRDPKVVGVKTDFL